MPQMNQHGLVLEWEVLLNDREPSVNSLASSCDNFKFMKEEW